LTGNLLIFHKKVKLPDSHQTQKCARQATVTITAKANGREIIEVGEAHFITGYDKMVENLPYISFIGRYPETENVKAIIKIPEMK
jgi:hypothetical protein